MHIDVARLSTAQVCAPPALRRACASAQGCAAQLCRRPRLRTAQADLGGTRVLPSTCGTARSNCPTSAYALACVPAPAPVLPMRQLAWEHGRPHPRLDAKTTPRRKYAAGRSVRARAAARGPLLARAATRPGCYSPGLANPRCPWPLGDVCKVEVAALSAKHERVEVVQH